MGTVLDFSCSDSSISLSVRSTRSGPENDLTEAFIDTVLPNMRDNTRNYALFYEPQLDTGFPDIVVARFNPKVFTNWSKERNTINTHDLKLLHHLYLSQGGNAEEIETKLGIDGGKLLRALERLMSAGLVDWRGKKWVPRSIRRTYAITSLVAIEAKISDWQSAFLQAGMNQWFASESYVLSPVAKPMERIVSTSRQKGIGIYSLPLKSPLRKIVPAVKTGIPLSYASWQFNEWIGRRLDCMEVG